MPNPQLNADQLQQANLILDSLRKRLRKVSGDDPAFHWALRRKIAKELVYDERGKPNHRRKLKTLKRNEQSGICPGCQEPLPATYCVLDRLEATAGYTVENTRLLCQDCDFRIQKERGYK
jgi:hypothetical protein